MLGRGYHHSGLTLVQRQTKWYLASLAVLSLDPDMPNLVTLMQDCVIYADFPHLAVDLGLACHPTVERWAAWAEWSNALDHALLGCRLLDRPLDLAQLLNYRSLSARETGYYEQALNAATEAFTIAEKHGHRGIMAAALNKIALVTFYRDELLEAQSIWNQAYTTGEGHASALEMGHICSNLGTFYIARNDFTQARQYFDLAREQYTLHGDPVQLAKLNCNIARIDLEEDFIDQAIAAFRAALDIFSATTSRFQEALALNNLGYSYLRANDIRKAQQFFELAVEKDEDIGATRAKAVALSNLAELFITTMNLPRANETLEEAHELATLCGMPLLLAAIDVDRGRLRLNFYEDKEGAREYWRKALEVQTRRGALLAARKTEELLSQLD